MTAWLSLPVATGVFFAIILTGAGLWHAFPAYRGLLNRVSQSRQETR